MFESFVLLIYYNVVKRWLYFFAHFARDFHAVVTDKVVNHFQLVEELFFVEGFTFEVEADSITNLFILCPRKVSSFDFFVHNFNNYTKRSQRSAHNGAQSNASRNC